MDPRSKTARSRGAIGREAVIPRHIIRERPKGNILDYGCGKDMLHVKMLRKHKLSVFGYDIVFLSTATSKLLHEYAIHQPPENCWHVVYASNVINIQQNVRQALDMVEELAKLVEPDGKVFFNLPPNGPFHFPITNDVAWHIARIWFNSVFFNQVNGIYVCEQPRKELINHGNS